MKRYWYITPKDFEIAEENGIKKDTVIQRVRRFGWDVDRAVKIKPKYIKKEKEILDLAKKHGINSSTIDDRVRNGWDLIKACTEPIRKKGRPRIYPDWVYEKAKENGIRFSIVNHRIHRGWDLERACTEKVWSREERNEKNLKRYQKSN